MKNRIISGVALLFMVLLVTTSGAIAQDRGPTGSTAVQDYVASGFSYQGRLEDAGGPVNDSCDFAFSLFEDQVGSVQVGDIQYHNEVSVTDGLFVIPDLDFGWNIFNGEARYLKIYVRCPAGGGTYSELDPLQPITASPYALALPGMRTSPGDDGPNVIGGISGNEVREGISGGTIAGGGVSWGYNFVYDHAGTVGGGANNQAGSDDEDLWNGDGATISGGWNNIASGPISTVGGGANNENYAYASTISGGENNFSEDAFVTIGGGNTNYASGGSATIAGGESNAIFWSWASSIGGGYTHTINADAAVIAGGFHNIIDGWGGAIGGGSENYAGEWVATVGGGDSNQAAAPATTIAGGTENIANNNEATVGGGSGNLAEGLGSSILGGYDNTASGYASSVPGGESNTAGGDYSFAAGQYASATHNGSFVWSDSSGGFNSTGDNQFLIDASGGVGIGTNNPMARLEVAGGDLYISHESLGIGVSNPQYPIEIDKPVSFMVFSDSDDGIYDKWLMGLNGANHRFEIWEQTGSGDPLEYRFSIDQDGMAELKTLKIMGGDLAEPFQINGEVEAGMVVVIDSDNPGQLRPSDKAYDRLVAGCVSGANGLEAGVIMYQEIGEYEDAFPVALSGRVYCWADASYGAIQPGDLLTTSDTPGHLMVVSDYDQAQGAIVGKAMEGLAEGQALILILVTLQ